MPHQDRWSQEQLEAYWRKRAQGVQPGVLAHAASPMNVKDGVIQFSKRAKRNHFEDDDQMALIEALRHVRYGEHCVADIIFHPANGGKRNALEAARLKRMGVNPGVFDLVLPVSINSWRGAFLELKHGKNKATQLQKDFARRQYCFGYYVAIFWSWEDCMTDIICYLRAGNLPLRVDIRGPWDKAELLKTIT
jgi:hypothetical protein